MSKKILVIDDEPDMVTFLSTLLEENGYDTVPASDGEEGLEKARTQKPDLVSLDLLMPNKSGFKMFRELRKDEGLKDIPVVMVTGFAKDDVPQMDFKEWIQKRAVRGPEAYIEKPVNKEAYVETIRNLIG